MLTGIVLACTIGYSSYNPFDFTSYREKVYTRSVAACERTAARHRHGWSSSTAYDLADPAARRRFEIECGPDGQDCRHAR